MPASRLEASRASAIQSTGLWMEAPALGLISTFSMTFNPTPTPCSIDRSEQQEPEQEPRADDDAVVETLKAGSVVDATSEPQTKVKQTATVLPCSHHATTSVYKKSPEQRAASAASTGKMKITKANPSPQPEYTRASIPKRIPVLQSVTVTIAVESSRRYGDTVSPCAIQTAGAGPRFRRSGIKRCPTSQETRVKGTKKTMDGWRKGELSHNETAQASYAVDENLPAPTPGSSKRHTRSLGRATCAFAGSIQPAKQAPDKLRGVLPTAIVDMLKVQFGAGNLQLDLINEVLEPWVQIVLPEPPYRYRSREREPQQPDTVVEDD
ncbi:hypothetical protein XPA_010226 [Xanthoria parietina]